MAGIVLQGLQELMGELKKLPENIGAKSKVAFNQFAEGTIGKAKDLCPYDPKRKRGTHLRDSSFIRKAESNFRPTAWLGFKAPHAFLVHEDIAGKHPAEHYSTPGTGAKYLERPFLAGTAKLEGDIDKIISEEMR